MMENKDTSAHLNGPFHCTKIQTGKQTGQEQFRFKFELRAKHTGAANRTDTSERPHHEKIKAKIKTKIKNCLKKLFSNL